MKNNVVCLIAGLLVSSLVYSANLNICPNSESKLVNHLHEQNSIIYQQEDTSYSDWDLTYNKIDIIVNPGIYRITGSVYFEFTSLRDNLDSIVIDLSDTLQINSLGTNNDELSYFRKNHQVFIKLAKPLNNGEKGSFMIEYKGIPMALWETSYSLQPVNQIIPGESEKYKYNQLYTHSEPYNARGWWPCKQSLIDKIDSIDIFIETSKNYEVASNGLLISNSISGSKRYVHWKHKYPIATYLVFFSVAPYEIYSDWATLSDGTHLEILNYVFPDEVETFKLLTPLAAEFIEYYSKLLIDYPFKKEKYGHARVQGIANMEHQTMTTLSSTTEYVMIHELAHQWFGDFITCGSWQDVWLNEGFATFFHTNFQGRENRYRLIDAWKVAQWSAKILEEGSVFVKDVSNENDIFNPCLSYDKGACILHMLQGLFGDSIFYQGLKKYLTDSRVQYGFATTKLFQEIMETTADTSLTEFFNDYFYGEGYPIYDIDCHQVEKHLEFTLTQTQSYANSPFFEMDIPVSVYHNNDVETIWLKNRAESESFEFDLDFAPTKIIVNEYQYALGEFNYKYTDVPLYNTSEFAAWFNSDNKTLNINTPNNLSGKLWINNVNGQTIVKRQWTRDDSHIRLGNYQSGIYLVFFKSNEKLYHTKVLIR